MSDVSSNGTNSNTLPANQTGQTVARRRTPWPLAVVAVLFVVVPFAFWYGTWFGRPLKDEDIEKYLNEEKNPRHRQHALSQIEERIAAGDESVKRWYPQVAALASNQITDVRMTAAWVMGADHREPEFRAALLRLLQDPEPIVRRNAALALVRFGDTSGRPEILAMLRPYTVTSPFKGTAQTTLREGSQVTRESLLTRVRSEDVTHELRSPLPGRVEKSSVEEGKMVAEGDHLFVLAPEEKMVWEALRALDLIGQSEDLTDVERYARGVEGMPDRIKQQAALTAEAIKRRASQNQQGSGS